MKYVCAALIAACAAGPVAAGPPPAPDSLDIIEQIVVENGAEEIEAAEIAADILAAQPARPWARASGSRLRFEKTSGYRDSFDSGGGLRAAGWSGSFGLRRQNGATGSYVRLATNGGGVRVVAGGVRPALGRNLLLGAAYSTIRPVRSSARDPSLAATATRSVWSRTRGAVVTAERGGRALSFAAWRDRNGRALGWTSLRRSAGGQTAGVAVGGIRFADTSPVRFAGGSVFVDRGIRAGRLSVEVATVRRRLFAAVRLEAEAGGRWIAEVYRAPLPARNSGGAAVPEGPDTRRYGGALYRSGSLGGGVIRLGVCGATAVSHRSSVRHRRLEVLARGRAGGGSWNATVRLSQSLERLYPAGVLAGEPQEKPQRELLVRAGWTGGASTVLRQRYRLTGRLDETGGVGVVGILGWDVTWRGLDAGIQVSDHALRKGQTGLVARPGFAGADAVSVVTSCGSDVSARIRLQLNRLNLRLHWSLPRRSDARWYAGVGFFL
jgi:hypothetical protein